jgi:hypothetical protein
MKNNNKFDKMNERRQSLVLRQNKRKTEVFAWQIFKSEI